jgi:hypothetical protein
MKVRKKVPTFKNEDAERAFWAKNDTTEYLDWCGAERIEEIELLRDVRAAKSRSNRVKAFPTCRRRPS